MPITFPNLALTVSIDPVAFSLGAFHVRWYGILIGSGFLLAVIYGLARKKDFGLTEDHILSMLLAAVPSAIICARIYYVASRWSEVYAKNPISALYIWEGGIAIYGGVIGAALGLLLFAKVKKQKLTPYLDIMGLGLLIGQLVGRWGNFFNREAYGAEIFDNFFLRMGLTENGVTRYWHPTFLYESVWNLVGFILLHFLSKKRKYDGQVFLGYVAWYGLGRAWIEGLRTDSLYLGSTGIRTSQLLAIVSCVVAVGLMLYIRFAKKPDGSTMLVNVKKAEAISEPALEPAVEQGDPENLE